MKFSLAKIVFSMLVLLSVFANAQTFNEVETGKNSGTYIGDVHIVFEDEVIDADEYNEYNQGYADNEEVYDGYKIELEPDKMPGHFDNNSHDNQNREIATTNEAQSQNEAATLDMPKSDIIQAPSH